MMLEPSLYCRYFNNIHGKKNPFENKFSDTQSPSLLPTDNKTLEDSLNMSID